MYCINCGNEIDEINQICHGCGTRLDENKKRFVGIQKKKIEDNDRITDTIKKKYCEHCGNTINDNIGSVTREKTTSIKTSIVPGTVTLPNVVTDPKKSGIAAVLSFLIPGLGQIYKGKIGIGSIFLITGLALIQFNVSIIEEPKIRQLIPDIRDATLPGIKESLPDIRIILFIVIYILFWIYNMHHAYTINHEEAEKQIKKQIGEQIEKM